MTTPRVSIASATTLGWSNFDKPEISLILNGPRGGRAGSACLAPSEARKLAQRLINAAEEVDPDREWAECANCAWSDKVHELNPITRIEERVAPGEIMPAGECPQCGALAHLKG